MYIIYVSTHTHTHTHTHRHYHSFTDNAPTFSYVWRLDYRFTDTSYWDCVKSNVRPQLTKQYTTGKVFG